MISTMVNFLKKRPTSFLSKNKQFFRFLITEKWQIIYQNKTYTAPKKSTTTCAAAVCDDNYVPGLIILIESIKKHNPWFNLPFIVFGDNDKHIGPKNQELLLKIYPYFEFENLGDQYAQVKEANEGNMRYNRFSQTFLGLNAFNLTKYQKVLYLDTDILCLGDFTPLLSDTVEADFLGIGDSQQPTEARAYFQKINDTKVPLSINSTAKVYDINTGVYVINSGLISQEVFKQLFTLATEGVIGEKNLGGDQDVINHFLKTHSYTLAYMPFDYNSSLRTYRNENFSQLKEKPPVFIHYLGKKPWSEKLPIIGGKLSKIRWFWVEQAQWLW